jgi:predicted nucleic acid-binding Zn ribbon protein
MSDEPLTDCPKCGKEVRRLIGGGMGIIFKGSGFYVTDNRSGSPGGNGSKSGDGSGSSKDSKDSKDSAGKESSTSSNTKSKQEVKK